MNKFIKLTGITALLVSLTSLLRKNKINEIKSLISQDKRLFSQLMAELKGSKQSLGRFLSALNRTDLSKIPNHLNQFNLRIQPNLKTIKRDVERIKKD